MNIFKQSQPFKDVHIQRSQNNFSETYLSKKKHFEDFEIGRCQNNFSKTYLSKKNISKILKSEDVKMTSLKHIETK